MLGGGDEIAGNTMSGAGGMRPFTCGAVAVGNAGRTRETPGEPPERRTSCAAPASSSAHDTMQMEAAEQRMPRE